MYVHPQASHCALKNNPSSRALTFPPLRLDGLQLLDVAGVVEPQLHADERFAALDAQHVPRLRLRQQFAHGALRQTQHGLAEQLQQLQEHHH